MLAALIAAVHLAAAASVPTIPTPFGHRPAECIVEVPSGAHVEEDPHSSDLIISHPELGAYRHTADPICSDPLYAPAPHARHAPPPRRGLQASGNQSCNEMPCSCDKLPCNNWIDTAGWMLDPFDRVLPPRRPYWTYTSNSSWPARSWSTPVG
jgi:hypothetical protein